MRHHLPRLSVRLIDGGGEPRRVDVDDVTDSTTLADLIRGSVAGHPERSVPETVLVDGRLLPVTTPVVRAGVRRGSRIDVTAPAGNDAVGTCSDSPLIWRSVGGPDSGRRHRLAVGRSIIGSARLADVRLLDPSVAPLAAILDVDTDGIATLTDLSSGLTRPLDGGIVRSGATDAEVVRSSPPSIAPPTPRRPVCNPAMPSTQWTAHLVRRPVCAPVPPVPPVPAPVLCPVDAPPVGDGVWGTGMISGAVMLLGAIVMAVVVRQPMMLIMASVGVVGTAATAAVATVRRRRRRRRNSELDTETLRSFAAALRVQHLAETARRRCAPDLFDLADMAHGRGGGVWEHRLTPSNPLPLALGVGTVPWTPVVAHGEPLHPSAVSMCDHLTALDRVPVTLSIGGEGVTAIGVVGAAPDTAALVRSLVIQVAASVGPADVDLVIDDSASPGTWDWATWLPHVAGPEGVSVGSEAALEPWRRRRAVESAEPDRRRLGVPTDTDRHCVLVITDPSALTNRTAPWRRFLSSNPSVTVLVIAATHAALPAICRTSICIDDSGRIEHDEAVCRYAGITVETATGIAADLAGLSDPESSNAAAEPLGGTLETWLGDVLVSPAALCAAWAAGGSDPRPTVTLGGAIDGRVVIDLASDGPHALIAGTTGAGKSELLRTLVAGLAVSTPPELLQFVLIDYKGGAAFDRCASLPHVVGVVTDLDEHLAGRVLVSLEAELKRRERWMRAMHASDLSDARSRAVIAAHAGAAVPDHGLARLVVVIDEFAALAAELPEFLRALVSIAQRGRSLGVHLVLATQRPSGVVDDDVRANTNLRIALRVNDRQDSIDVVDDPIAATLPRSRPGRAVVRLGPGELVAFQTARCTTDDGSDSSLDRLVRVVQRATELRGAPPALRPWLDPLPSLVRVCDLTAHDGGPDGTSVDGVWEDGLVVGVIDRPAAQRRDLLTWNPAEGHLLVVGSRGSGTTTTLRSLSSRALERGFGVYGVTQTPTEFAALSANAGCGGVIGLQEAERIGALFDHLDATVAERSAGVDGPPIVLVIDGVGGLRSWLNEPGRDTTMESFERIVRSGAAAGVSIVASADTAAAIPHALFGRSVDRWVFRLNDRSDAVSCGVTASAIPTVIPPGRCVLAQSGDEAQVAILDDALDPAAAVHSPLWKVPQVPAFLKRSTLPADGELAIGLSTRTLQPLSFDARPGLHVVIGGPSRSGRSSALSLVADEWRRVNHVGFVCALFGRRPSRAAGAADVCAGSSVDAADAVRAAVAADRTRPVLLVIDDADLVDDPGGALAALFTGPTMLDELNCVVAGRADVLRMAYGHWTAQLRRARTGLLLGAVSDADADVIGATLPRYHRRAAAPGVGYAVRDGRIEPIIVAFEPTTTRLSEQQHEQEYETDEDEQPDADRDRHEQDRRRQHRPQRPDQLTEVVPMRRNRRSKPDGALGEAHEPGPSVVGVVATVGVVEEVA